MSNCQRRLALWCSVGILIFSVVLLSLYFSCMGNCMYQPKSAYAPIWTALLCIALTIFGFIIAFKTHNNTIGTLFASVSVVCMICTLVCVYLIIGALIGERKRKSVNDNYMTAMFLWIAMAGATGMIFIFTVIITCGFLCCQCRKKENVDLAAEDAWSTNPRPKPGDFIRDPPYAPTIEVTDQSDRPESVIAPTAPPLFMSVTLQRETGMDVSPSSDRRSFCANIVEMSRSETSIEDLIAETNSYTEMPSFMAKEDGQNDELRKPEEVETNMNNCASGLHVNNNHIEGSIRYSEISDESPTRSDDAHLNIGNGNSIEGSIRYSEITNEDQSRSDAIHCGNGNNIEGSVRYSEITNEDPSRSDDNQSGNGDNINADKTDNDEPESQYAEITSTLDTEDTIANRERAPDMEDSCAINYDYDYATTQPRLVSLPSLEEEINYVNNTLPKSSNSPISLSNTDVSL